MRRETYGDQLWFEFRGKCFRGQHMRLGARCSISAMLRAAAVVALLATVTAQPPGGPERWSRVAEFHKQRATQAGIVGSSLLFVKEGKVAGTSFQGVQDLETKRPVDGDTIFHWASITKMFTGVAIMQLRDRGKLSLDDPAARYVPELRDVHSRFGDISQVTVRQLMSHTGGFRASTWPWGGSQPWHPYEPTTWDQLVAMMPYTELLFAPGTRYAYSNPGIIFLGRIIERLSGDEYETYITKNIFMPLGMTRSFFDRAPYHLLAHRSHSYERDADRLQEGRFDFDSGITVSNGGLNAPLADMGRWVAFLTGAAAPDGAEVLGRASLAEMFVPQIRAKDGEGGSGDDVQAGLSCFIERHRGVELIGHSGDQNGFIAHLYVHRPSNAGYVVAFNTNAGGADPARSTRAVDNDLRDLIIEQLFR